MSRCPLVWQDFNCDRWRCSLEDGHHSSCSDDFGAPLDYPRASLVTWDMQQLEKIGQLERDNARLTAAMTEATQRHEELQKHAESMYADSDCSACGGDGEAWGPNGDDDECEECRGTGKRPAASAYRAWCEVNK